MFKYVLTFNLNVYIQIYFDVFIFYCIITVKWNTIATLLWTIKFYMKGICCDLNVYKSVMIWIRKWLWQIYVLLLYISKSMFVNIDESFYCRGIINYITVVGWLITSRQLPHGQMHHEEGITIFTASTTLCVNISYYQTLPTYASQSLVCQSVW